MSDRLPPKPLDSVEWLVVSAPHILNLSSSFVSEHRQQIQITIQLLNLSGGVELLDFWCVLPSFWVRYL